MFFPLILGMCSKRGRLWGSKVARDQYRRCRKLEEEKEEENPDLGLSDKNGFNFTDWAS